MKKLLLVIATCIVLVACKKEEALVPTFHVGDEVQFSTSIEHDFNRTSIRYYNYKCKCILEKYALHIYDIPQPFHIDSFKYNNEWKDNWYWVSTRYVDNGDTIKIKRDTSIDEGSLQLWTGTLKK